MSGCYKGVQAEILRKNPQALYAPCSAHSLNLCGVQAVEATPEIKSFFEIFRKCIMCSLQVHLAGKFLKRQLAFRYTACRRQGGVQELMQ